MKRNMIIVFLIIGFCSQLCWATSSSVGTSGAQFLKIGVGGRTMGMGGAYVAVSDDVNAMYVNPAGMSQIEKKQIQAQHIEWFEGINYESLAGAYPLNDKVCLGAAISYQNIDGIEGRSGDTDAVDRYYGADDQAFIIGMSQVVNDKLSLGANLKYVRLTIDSKEATAFAGDIGALYIMNDKLHFGASLQNFGEKVKFVSESDPLPLNFKWGLSYKMCNDKLLVAFDTNHPNDNYMNSVLGLEYMLKFKDNFSMPVRMGYKTLNDFDTIDSFSFGLGLGFKDDLALDIAWIPYGDLGNTYRMSLLLKFK